MKQQNQINKRVMHIFKYSVGQMYPFHNVFPEYSYGSVAAQHVVRNFTRGFIYFLRFLPCVGWKCNTNVGDIEEEGGGERTVIVDCDRSKIKGSDR
jgi:hypothetical protein